MTRQTAAPLNHTTLSASYRRARELARLVDDGDLDLTPPYQRGAVWTDDQRIALIRSWLTGIPSGTVILSDRVNNWWAKANGSTPLDTGAPTWSCVDGKQRISTASGWFASQIAVPASWFEPQFIEVTEDTTDGPYVRYSGLTEVGRRVVDSRALIQVAEAKTCATVQDEAAIYLLVNGGGTPQSDADMANARHIADPLT